MNPADAGKVIEEMLHAAEGDIQYTHQGSMAREEAKGKVIALTIARDWLAVGEWLEKHHGRQYRLEFHRYVSEPQELWMIVQVSQIIHSAPTIHELAAKLKESP